MSKSVNRLLTVPPSCCCNSLNTPSSFSPWASDIMQKSKPLGSHRYHRMIFEADDCLSCNSKIFSTSKHHVSSNASSLSSDSRSSSLPNSKLLMTHSSHSSHQIPYQFAHQSSSTSAIEEYRSKYTYPTLQKRVVSAHTVERSNCAVKYSTPAPSCNNCYTRSLSESQISTMLKPRTVMLEDSLGRDAAASDQTRKPFIPKGRVLPSPKLIIGYNQAVHSKYEVLKSSPTSSVTSLPVSGTPGLDKKLSSMKCTTSHPELPSAASSTGGTKPNKAKVSTEDVKKKYSLKPSLQKKTATANKSSAGYKPPGSSSGSKCGNRNKQTNNPPQSSSSLRIKSSNPVHKFGYSSATSQSQQHQQTMTAGAVEDRSSKISVISGPLKYSVRMISSPWEDRRNTL